MVPPRSRRHFAGRIVEVSVEPATLPNGACIDLEVVRHPGGAAVVALDTRGRVCLLRHYRHVVGRWLWELPAGKIDHGEPPDNTARRELLDETGLSARDWAPLGAIHSSPGVFTEVVHLYLALGLEYSAPDPDDDEVFETRWLALDEAIGWALDGKISDAKTVIGLLRARAVLAAQPGSTPV